MAKLQKMEYQMEIKSSPARFFQIFRTKQHLIPKMCPQSVKDIKLVQGNGYSVGSVIEWSFAAAGNVEASRLIVEDIDDENKAITFNVDGETFNKYYKTLKANVQVTGNFVKWTVEYEKQNDDVPPPTKYMDLSPIINKSIDDYLSKNSA